MSAHRIFATVPTLCHIWSPLLSSFLEKLDNVSIIWIFRLVLKFNNRCIWGVPEHVFHFQLNPKHVLQLCGYCDCANTYRERVPPLPTEPPTYRAIFPPSHQNLSSSINLWQEIRTRITCLPTSNLTKFCAKDCFTIQFTKESYYNHSFRLKFQTDVASFANNDATFWNQAAIVPQLIYI